MERFVNLPGRLSTRVFWLIFTIHPDGIFAPQPSVMPKVCPVFSRIANKRAPPLTVSTSSNNLADIVKMIESQPELETQLRRVRGGYLKIQGTWMPYEVCLHSPRPS